MQKVVVITGASSGIGAELARQLGARGDKLALAARTEAALERVAADVKGEALVVPTDVTRRAEVERLRDEALARFERVDAWVSNAGRGINRSWLDLPERELDEMLAVNLKSVYYGAQAIVPVFQRQGHGHLVNVGSFLGRVPFAPYRSAYSAARAGVAVLSSHLRQELARTHPDVHVSLVMPGIVETPFHEHALHGTPPFAPGTPTQKVEDVARAIVGLLDAPKAELYTTPHQAPLAARYVTDAGAFEAEQRR
jgi:short-subunit dehydrogenase